MPSSVASRDASLALTSVSEMIVAIDGPAASGKSTVARELAKRMGSTFLDTGAMYRAVAWQCLEQNLDPHSEEDCQRLATDLQLDFDSVGCILVDGQPGEPHIRKREVDRIVSPVSAHSAVRRLIVARQRELAVKWGQLVAEGRDTTTVVFPRADLKFFLKASSEERARRRARELGAHADVRVIQAEIERRDQLDTEREDSPLTQAKDAIAIDTDGQSPEQIVEVILSHASRAAQGQESTGSHSANSPSEDA